MAGLANLIWTIVVILVLIWLISLLLGWAFAGVGWLLHLLLVVAIILIILNLLTGRPVV